MNSVKLYLFWDGESNREYVRSRRREVPRVVARRNQRRVRAVVRTTGRLRQPVAHLSHLFVRSFAGLDPARSVRPDRPTDRPRCTRARSQGQWDGTHRNKIMLNADPIQCIVYGVYGYTRTFQSNASCRVWSIYCLLHS